MAVDGQALNLLTVRETAALLKQSERSIRRKITEGLLPGVRLGDATEPLRVPVAELQAWLDERRTTSRQGVSAGDGSQRRGSFASTRTPRAAGPPNVGEAVEPAGERGGQ